MDCETYRRLISLALDGELPPEAAENLAHHLETCPGCAAFRTDLHRLREIIAAEPILTLSPEATERIRRAAGPLLAEGRRGAFRLLFLKAAAAALLLLSVTVGLFALRMDTLQAVDPSKEIHYEDLFQRARRGEEGVLVEILLKTGGPREALELYSSRRHTE